MGSLKGVSKGDRRLTAGGASSRDLSYNVSVEALQQGTHSRGKSERALHSPECEISTQASSPSKRCLPFERPSTFLAIHLF